MAQGMEIVVEMAQGSTGPTVEAMEEMGTEGPDIWGEAISNGVGTGRARAGNGARGVKAMRTWTRPNAMRKGQGEGIQSAGTCRVRDEPDCFFTEWLSTTTLSTGSNPIFVCTVGI